MTDLRTNNAELILRAVCDVGTSAILRGTDGGAITDDRRNELLAAVKEGKHVELEVDIVPFRQKDGDPNRKFVRVRPGAMRATGRSGKGKPFLTDHAQWDMRQVGGYVTASSMDTEIVAGAAEWVLRQTVRLTAPWAVDMALRDLLRFFSVGLRGGVVLCLACKADYLDCYHYPGQQLDDGTTVEIEFQDPELDETSAVPVPAVTGTYVDAIRAAMTAARAPGLDAGKKNPQSGRMKFARLAALLAITLPTGADLDDDAACTAVEGLKKQATKVELERDAFKLRAETAEKDLADVRGQLGAREATERTSKLDAAIEKAYADKKLVRTTSADGASVADPFESILRRHAELDSVDAAVAQIGTLRVREVFSPQLSGGRDPNPPLVLGKGAKGMSEAELAAHRKYATDTGKDPDKYIAEITAEQGA